jgi:hypothetical protein
VAAIDRAAARAIIESLRYGTPPAGYVREFTVGRQLELSQLEETITAVDPTRGSALLVRANYGGGKSHLLRIVRERALEVGYAVALVVTDAVGGVRFNRMDTIFGAVTREIEVPGVMGQGIRTLFDAFRRRCDEVGQRDRLIQALSANGGWSQKGQLSDPVLIGLRAWVLGGEAPRSLVEEWYAWPEPYRNRRRDLYYGLVADLEHRFDDRRSEARYYADKSLAFHNDGHRNAWDGLGDLHAVAVASGFRGLVLLFDEFEDVIQNLPNRSYQVASFQNLFDFFSGSAYLGMTYFAVTPDFAKACRDELRGRGVYDFPVGKFSKLPAFELAPITDADFAELARRIAVVHGIALDWHSGPFARGAEWDGRVSRAWGRPAPDQIRQAIQAIVAVLDSASRPGQGAA